MYNLLEETVLQPSWQHLNSSKIAIQQLSGDLNISTVFSGALEQVTTCGVRAANQVYRESKGFLYRLLQALLPPPFTRFPLPNEFIHSVSSEAPNKLDRLRKSRTSRMRLLCIVQCRGFFFAVLGSCLSNYH
jgi:hypothetical protein